MNRKFHPAILLFLTLYFTVGSEVLPLILFYAITSLLLGIENLLGYLHVSAKITFATSCVIPTIHTQSTTLRSTYTYIYTPQSISTSTAPIHLRTLCDPWGRNRQVIVKLDLDRVNQHWRLTLDQKQCFQSYVTSLTKRKLGKSYTPDSPYHCILRILCCLKKQTTCTVCKPVWTSTSLPFATCSQSFSYSLHFLSAEQYPQVNLSTLIFTKTTWLFLLPSLIPRKLPIQYQRNSTRRSMIIVETRKLGEMKTVGTTQTIGTNKKPNPNSILLSVQIDWVFDHVNINQIREITGCLFAQNFWNQFEEANRFPFHADTLHPSILELEESTIEEQEQDQ